MRTCANCGEPLRGLDGRYKYCSEECYIEAHRRQCRENYHRRYWANLEEYREINRRNYYARKKNNAHKAQEK